MDPSYNSFGRFDLSGGQPIASGAVMPAADNTKKKRGLIIGIILAVVAVVGVVGFALSSQKTTSKTVMQKLNEYSNYLLFGTDSSEDIKLETDWPSSLLANKTYNSNEDYDEGYFDSLIKKLESFAAAFSKSYQEKELEDEEKYELIISLIESIKISLNAAKGYAGKSALTEQQLKDLSVEKVKEYYSSFTDSDNSILQKIADNNVGLSQAMKENNTDAIEYYSRDLSRTEGNLVADVIRSSAWIYDMVSENGSEK